MVMDEKLTINGVYNLTPMQEGMLFHSYLNPDNPAYFEQFSCTISGQLDVQRLENSFNVLIHKYDVLRLNFLHENIKKPKQVVFKKRNMTVMYENIIHLDASNQAQFIQSYIEADQTKGFDLAKDLLLRAAVLQTDDQRYKLIWSYHHIIMDGWCLKTIVQELFDVYRMLSQGIAPQLDEAPPFANYIQWLDQQDLEEARSYWRKYLQDYESIITIPTFTTRHTDSQPDHHEPQNVLHHQVDRTYKIDEDTVSRLEQIAKAHQVTLNTVLQSACALLLGRYNRTEDVVFGSVTSGRPAEVEGVDRMVGLFINTIPIRISFQGHQSFSSLIQQVQQASLETQSYDFYPLAEIQSLSQIKQNLINHIYAFQNYPVSADTENASDDLFTISDLEDFEQTHYDFNLIMMPNDGLDVKFKYNPLKYEQAAMDRLFAHFEQVLHTVSNNVNVLIQNISVITNQERLQIVHQFNDMSREYPRHLTIPELFEQQAELTPMQIALVQDDVKMTYKQLANVTDRLAVRLIQNGVAPDQIVGIIGDRSIHTVVGMLGILKAGGAYLPIDPEYPDDRIEYMLQDSQAKWVLAPKCYVDRNLAEIEMILFDLDELAAEANSSISKHDELPVQTGLTPSNLAYVMYTSGSTGRPKGVMVEHRNVVRLIKNTNYIPLNPGDRILQTGAPVFDACTFEIWGALLNGLELYIVDKHTILDAQRLGSVIREYGISTLWMTTPLFNQLAQQQPELFQPLRYFIFGGDIVSLRHVQQVGERCEQLTMIHAYGPTENTTFSTCYTIDSYNESNISIGGPIANSTAYVVDLYGQLSPIGVPGEMWVGGDGLARGYINNEALTSEKFIPSPFVEGERIYRTGDAVSWLPDGTIDFIGRFDNQVKIRGFRIEIGEIEIRLRLHENVKEAVVRVWNKDDGSKALCAYLVSEGEITSAELKGYISGFLPDYMIPSYWIFMDRLPLTPNGKVDHRALPDPKESIVHDGEYTEPRNEIEQKLADIWGDILGIPTVSVYDHFFDLGGHSLNALKLVTEIKKQFQTQLPLAQIFEKPVLADIAVLIAKNEQSDYSVIEPAQASEFYPVSSAQKRLYILNDMTGMETAYNIPFVMEITGKLDVERLEQAFQTMISRHEALRTSFSFIKGEIYQKVHENVPFSIEYLDVSTDLEVEEIVDQFVTPFNLSQAPLVRAGLVKRKEEQFVFIFDIHHIIADGTSIGVIVKEFTDFYNGQSVNKLDHVRIHYKDFAVWQNKQLAAGTMERQEKYWLEQFSNEPPVLNLQTDYPRPHIQSFEGAVIEVEIDHELTSRLKNLAHETGSTLYMVLFAAYSILLSKYTSQEDIVIGTPTVGRTHAEVLNTVGMFVNMLALRVEPKAEETFSSFLDEVKRTTLQAFDNQELQYEELIEKLGIQRDMSRNPLFDTVFTLQNIEIQEVSLNDLNVRSYSWDGRMSKFDLTLTVAERQQGMVINAEYSVKLFEADTITRLIEHYAQILQAIVENSETRLADIEILSESERMKVLVDFNGLEVDFSKNSTVDNLFNEQVIRTPDHIAIVFKDQQLTYKELDERVNWLAHDLRSRGVGPGKITAIMIEHSVEMVVSVLAVLKAGGAYLPIDHEYPAGRIAYILENSQATLLLTRSSLIRDKEISIPWIDLEVTISQFIKGVSLSPLQADHSPTDLAYVIYTSGSTGKPKGVMVEHRSLLNMTQWYQAYYELTAGDKCTKYAGFGFDASVWEIFPTLLSGSELHIIPEEIRYDVQQLSDYYNRNCITVSFLPTAICEQFIPLNNDSLRVLITGGDKLKVYRPTRYALINNYGPTENTIVTSAFKVNGAYDNIPIGKPIHNVRVYILDSNNKLLPIGVPGELCVAGSSLARGYLNRPDLTAEKFTSDPFNPGERMYRTGDLARWLPGGNLEYLGRMDEQVKIRGYRIELGEVENVILKHEHIHEVVVLAVQNPRNESELCAYIVLSETLTIKEVREWLAKELPAYMIPTHYVLLEELPLTANGKVNKHALPLPDFEQFGNDNYVPPTSVAEQKLAQIWSEVLGVLRIGAHSHFFELGGHSLKAATLASGIKQAFQVEFPLSTVFHHPTLEQMAASIETLEQSAMPSIERIPNRDFYPVSSAQKRLLILNEMDGAGTAYNMPFVMQLTGNLDRGRLQQAFERLIRRHAVFRTSFQLIDGELVQIVHQDAPFAIEDVEVRDGVRKINDAIQQFVRPFNLKKAPLIRVGLASLPLETYILIIDMHHIVSDGTSVRLLVEELSQLYSGVQLSESGFRIEYKDYAVWQSDMLRTGQFKEQEKYWLERLSGELPVLTLPTDYPRPQIQSFEGDSFTVTIDSDLSSQIIEATHHTSTTLYMFLLAAYNILLSKYANQEDIIVGTPIAGRSLKEMEDVIGIFVNTLAIRNQPEGSKRFKDFLSEVKEHTLQAFENQGIQYEDLLEKLDIQRDMSRNPLFDTMFAVDNVGVEDIQLDGLCMEPFPFDNGTSKFDLMVTATEVGEQITLDVEYSNKLFKKATIERLIMHYIHILRSITANLEIKLSSIGLLLEEERDQIIHVFNDTKTIYPLKTIHELFEEQAVQHADRIAVVSDDIQITYRELNNKANQLAITLRDRGIGPDKIVAIIGDRSIEMILGMLAILKAGGAYLPIDPDYPMDRVEYFLKHSEATVLMGHNGYADRAIDGVEFVALDYSRMDDMDVSNLHHVTTPNHLAYVMYTSGSTGLPKGVMVEHIGVSRLVRNTNYVRFSKEDRVLQTAAPVFDVSVFDIWGALLNGAGLYLIDKFTLLDPIKLETVLREKRITMLWLTSPLFTQFAQQKPDMFRSVQYLIVGGDILSPKHIQLVREHCQQLTVVNGYGPTENTSFSCCFTIEQAYEKSVPIGPPINNSTAYIVDKYGNLNPIGVPGELWVGGDGVARGYLNNEQLTQQKFIPNPFVTGDRVYRTGDAAKWLPDGSIEFIGRLDNQVKIRGFRVEIGEIENYLLSHTAVKEAVILVKEHEHMNKYLCAYVVAEEELSVQLIKEYLSQQLPDYMIPSAFVFMDQLPLNINGKVDRKSLPEPDYRSDEVDYTAPRDDYEHKIVHIWSQILGIERISIYDNFFELGGHSLKAIQMVSMLKELKWDISINQIFALKTPAELAAYVRRLSEMNNQKITDIQHAESWLNQQLKCQCKWLTYFVEDQEYLVIHITGLTDKIRHDAELLIAEHLGESIQPHYLFNADIASFHRLDREHSLTREEFNKLLNLSRSDAESWVDHMIDQIHDMQVNYATEIIESNVIKHYEISPSQKYHFQHKDVSGTMVKWNIAIQPELLSKVLQQIVADEEVMRSTFVHEKGDKEGYWRLHEIPARISVPIIDISHFEQGTQRDIMTALMERFFIQPYSENDPLMYRVLLIKQNVKEYLLLLPFSHTIFDYMSNEIVRNKVCEYYELLSQGVAVAVEQNRRETYTDFITQITRGPEGTTSNQINETYHLQKFCVVAKQIAQKMHRRDNSTETKMTIMNHRVNINESLIDFSDAESKWRLALGISAGFFSSYFDIEHVPMWMTHFGRQYGNKSYFDLVGECIDYIPILLDSDQDMDSVIEKIAHRIQFASDHNIHFSNLLYNEWIDPNYTDTRNELLKSFEEMPVNFNYLGELSEEADLDYLDTEGVNCDDSNRILYMTWYKGSDLYITLVIPGEENKNSIRSLIDDVAQVQIKGYETSRLKGVEL